MFVNYYSAMPSGMSLHYLQSTLVDISIMIRRACRSCGVVVLNACLYCPPLQVVTWVSTKYPNLDLRIACGCGNWKGLKTSSSWYPKWRCGSELFFKRKPFVFVWLFVFFTLFFQIFLGISLWSSPLWTFAYKVNREKTSKIEVQIGNI